MQRQSYSHLKKVMDGRIYSPRIVFWTACAGMLLFGICMITLGSLSMAIGQRFSMDEADIGTLFSVMPIGVLTGSMVFGPICDRYGYRIPLAASCMLLFIGFQGIAFAISTMQLSIFIFICGLGGGVVNGATNGVVADISLSDKGSNLSLLGIFFAVGAITVPSLLGFLGQSMPYSSVLSGIGFLPLPVMLACLIVRFPQPKLLPSVPLRVALSLAKNPLLLAMSGFLFLQAGLEAVVSNWTTRYLSEWKGLEQPAALYALTLSVIGMALARVIIGGALRGWSTTSILSISMAITLLALLLIVAGNGSVAAYAGLFLTGFGISAAFPLMMGMIGDAFPRMSASAFSIALAIALSGNMVVNIAMGELAKHYGIQWMPAVGLGLVVLMALQAGVIIRIKSHHL